MIRNYFLRSGLLLIKKIILFSVSNTGFSDNSVDDPTFEFDDEEVYQINQEEIDKENEVSEEEAEDNNKNENKNNSSNATHDESLHNEYVLQSSSLLKEISLLEKSVNLSATCDDTNINVPVSKKSGGLNKFNVCLYCHKKQQKIARHLEYVHKNEDEVKKFKDLPPGSKERMNIIAALRKRGNFNYNTKENLNDGLLVVTRRPNATKKRKAEDFIPCANCKGFFAKSSIRVHFKECTGVSSKSTRFVMAQGRRIAARLHKKASRVVKEKLFPPLREDEIARIVRYDDLVITYANKMCDKYRNERYFDMIRQRIRILGRFLCKIKSINNEVQDLASVFDPKFCEDALRAIHMLAHLNEETGNFDIPTVAFSLGTLIKCIGNILTNECIINHDDIKRKHTKQFLSLFSQEVAIKINRAVTESQVEMRRRKTVQLPSTNDIKKLYVHLNKRRDEAFIKLKHKFTSTDWNTLAETTLLSIQVFNRRRPGEMERVLIDDFKCYEGLDNETRSEFSSILNTEQDADRYVRFLIRGKLNRTVPVILDKNQLESIKLILETRENARVHPKNPYVFGTPGPNNKFLRACSLIRKYSIECGADHPERLRGTKLRKHIATTCIKLNLQDDQVRDLANFMGHNEKIHRNIYRQPVASRDILRMSKLLEIAQGKTDECESSSDESIGKPLENENLLKKKRKSKSRFF